jgi:predicted Fe-Mo cluster-binding NifX family protein
MRIAITSSNGKKVDTHFGKANKFYVYELENSLPKYIEERDTFNYCPGTENHTFDSQRLEKIYKLIEDCQILCTVKIGEIPALKLLEKGINIVESEGELSDIFQNIN